MRILGGASWLRIVQTVNWATWRGMISKKKLKEHFLMHIGINTTEES